jgi:aminoglycoside phosphotransferase (APT) family kinase protein
MATRESTSDLDEPKLIEWLSSLSGEKADTISVKKFSAGQSNPTYRVDFAGEAYALRRKPFGQLLPSAHAIEREYKVISALHPTGFPAPRPIALCEDEAVIGVSFYLMEFVDGKIFRETTMPGSSKNERRAVNLELMRNLSELHKLDFKSIGLADFERPGNYFERQVKRWSKQYRACETETLTHVENLITFLSDSVPDQSGSSIIHGDYRLDNVSFEKNNAKVKAVLDWELTTIGDPIADLTYCTMYWHMPSADRYSLLNCDFDASGIPRLEEMQEHYAQCAGMSHLPQLDWYYAFNMFRTVGIFQGIKRRMLDGNASSSVAQEVVALIPGLAEKGWELAKNAGA